MKRYPKPFERKCRSGEGRHQYVLERTDGNIYVFRCQRCNGPKIRIPQKVYG